MNDCKNPWEHMQISSQRRLDLDTECNFFWMTDLQGNYGFYLQTNKVFVETNNLVKLKGVSILRRNSDENKGQLFLILHHKEDWQIFLTLCQDLINETHNCKDDEQTLSIFEARLKRWQNLLNTT
jgi:Putative  PD-(D/E)XK family member, (DUF4420)